MFHVLQDYIDRNSPKTGVGSNCIFFPGKCNCCVEYRSMDMAVTVIERGRGECQREDSDDTGNTRTKAGFSAHRAGVIRIPTKRDKRSGGVFADVCIV